ncbi:MAG: Lrp/AsnC family transcriptional regulator [Clostridia bacterium]|nr:Lrp/AsnC family transcriptional regulator [Clostridia bacterium]MBR5772155.1 Lrp/AsnC family transcriptional regulator [Clostridia bacterium]
MNVQILKLLAKDARMSASDISTVTGLPEIEVVNEIQQMKKDGLIRGFRTVIDWEKLDEFYVSAIVEIKVTPKAGLGFEDVAKKIARFHEVESVYLLSGDSDLSVIVKCKSFQDVSRFVAKELATIESVTSTKTQFVMRRYKELDVDLDVTDPDQRGVVSSC